MRKAESCNCWETGEKYHGGRSARAPPVAIQKFHIAVPPQGTLYITAKRPNHVTPD